jgi:hypothetical protein
MKPNIFGVLVCALGFTPFNPTYKFWLTTGKLCRGALYGYPRVLAVKSKPKAYNLSPLADVQICLLMFASIDLRRSENPIFLELFVPMCQPTGDSRDRKYRRK